MASSKIKALKDEDIVHALWRHRDNMNKVAVSEGAAGSPPFQSSSLARVKALTLVGCKKDRLRGL